MNFPDYINGFVALFAISNPIGNLPIYIGLTANRSKQQRQQTIRTASIAFAIILIVSCFMGEAILSAFGISIASFRVAGGFLIFIVGFHMLQAKTGEVKHTSEENEGEHPIFVSESLKVTTDNGFSHLKTVDLPKRDAP